MNNEEIASKYLFTDLAIKNLERDLQLIQNGPFKIKEPYIQFTERMISKAINERRKLKQLMHKNKLQVEYLSTQSYFVTYKYYLNGYVKEVTFKKQGIKKNVEKMIKGLI